MVDVGDDRNIPDVGGGLHHGPLPRSLLLGLYTSFLAGVTLLLLAGWWAWGRFYRGARSEAGTVAKNSAIQVASSLMNRGIDFAFAMLRLRILSPVGQGSYAFAISIYVTFETLTRFGLQTLLTRDVAGDKGSARRYLKNVIVLRTGLWLLSLPLIALVCLAYWTRGQLTPEQGRAIALLSARSSLPTSPTRWTRPSTPSRRWSTRERCRPS